MADQKIFAGARIRRIRTQRELTQTAMAADLGISPSYLNLIERNQRPLTVQLLLKLASVYKVDVNELQGGGEQLMPQLKQMFADPLLAGELPGDQELIEISEGAPNVASALIKLHRAYRESQERLSDLSDMLAREGHETRVASTRLPADEVRDALEKRPNHFARLEEEAESFIKLLSPGDDLAGALTGGMTTSPTETVNRNNMLSIFVDHGICGMREAADTIASRYLSWIKECSPQVPGSPVMLPGEVEVTQKKRRIEFGIDIPGGIWAQVVETADSLGIAEVELMKGVA